MLLIQKKIYIYIHNFCFSPGHFSAVLNRRENEVIHILSVAICVLCGVCTLRFWCCTGALWFEYMRAFFSLLFFLFSFPESWGAPRMRRWWWSYVINVCRRIYFIGSRYIFICGNKNRSFSIKKCFMLRWYYLKLLIIFLLIQISF